MIARSSSSSRYCSSCASTAEDNSSTSSTTSYRISESCWESSSRIKISSATISWDVSITSSSTRAARCGSFGIHGAAPGGTEKLSQPLAPVFDATSFCLGGSFSTCQFLFENVPVLFRGLVGALPSNSLSCTRGAALYWVLLSAAFSFASAATDASCFALLTCAGSPARRGDMT